MPDAAETIIEGMAYMMGCDPYATNCMDDEFRDFIFDEVAARTP